LVSHDREGKISTGLLLILYSIGISVESHKNVNSKLANWIIDQETKKNLPNMFPLQRLARNPNVEEIILENLFNFNHYCIDSELVLNKSLTENLKTQLIKRFKFVIQNNGIKTNSGFYDSNSAKRCLSKLTTK
jgi:hypothetical protein